ncbi:tail protein X [Chromobacterium sp. IIBBL 290-4]|uniref:tail protein X n=1 Tax=Chromobacterium sp. IIBBL 290-4 TaxID=2953890 RepID=UPI0020B6ACB7|nr:tail protein X [Chromobacterium sp. IIBBL 290-4]UTH73354.1 tail protein X [Chromobacterium sp. IIBBL 290-4]
MRAIRAMQGDTVDAIAWRVYGKTRGVVELLLQHNPGLAEHGPVLPSGARVLLPDLPADPAPAQTLINLWD